MDKIPILGICLGMQLLSNKSEEGQQPGLSFINADTVKFRGNENLILPHMGWNTIDIINESPILSNIKSNTRFYFVHSYHIKCNDEKDVVATTHYAYDFPSIIQRNNIIGVQFHPEKSHKQGIQLLRNFVHLSCDTPC